MSLPACILLLAFYNAAALNLAKIWSTCTFNRVSRILCPRGGAEVKPSVRLMYSRGHPRPLLGRPGHDILTGQSGFFLHDKFGNAIDLMCVSPLLNVGSGKRVYARCYNAVTMHSHGLFPVC